MCVHRALRDARGRPSTSSRPVTMTAVISFATSTRATLGADVAASRRSGRRVARRSVIGGASGSAGTADDKVKPDWAGDDLLSKVVDAAISNKVLYEGIMKPMARRTLINTAEKNGVAWRDIAEELGNEPAVKQALAEIENKSVEYPEYYLQPFHAYAEGNLCWQAAVEAEPATYSMALRVWPKDASPQTRHRRG